MPKIKALGGLGIIAVGRRVTDRELAEHGLRALSGEEAVYVPAELLEQYVAAVLQEIGNDLTALDQAHVAQIGGTDDEKTQA